MTVMKYQGKKINQLTPCPICEFQYSEKEITVLDEMRGRVIAHLTCRKCNSTSLVFVTGNQQGIVSVGVLTDLDKGEVESRFKSKPTSTNQVLDVYKYLNE